ncbi:MAG TPA: two-component regulator propeller domain-containing protein [Burkholderiaceae bacterium]|jgi:ligand-binding sensor domain-containing protein/signal transduction histidine kinase
MAPIVDACAMVFVALMLMSTGIDAFAGAPISLRFEQFKQGQGMDANIDAIAQDVQGFIWFASTNGLTRYDGYKTTTYKSIPSDPNSLTESKVFGLLADKKGRLWAGTRGGLHLYDRANDRFIRYRPIRADSSDLTGEAVEVRRIIEDGHGGLWLATNDGLRHFDPDTGRFSSMVHDPNDPASLVNDHVIPLALDPDGNLWVGTIRGLDFLAPGATRFVHYRLDDGTMSVAHNNVQSLLFDAKGTLWIGTEKGLEAWTLHAGEPKRRIFGKAEGIEPQWIRSLYEDNQGTIWLTSVSNGVIRWDPANGRFFAYRHRPGDPHSLADNYVFSIFQDRSGTLWIGTFSNGANRVDLSSGGFSRISQQSDGEKQLSSDKIRAVLMDPNSKTRVWLATTDGLDMLDTGTGAVSVFRHDPRHAYDLAHDRLASLTLDRQGRIWVASELGLSRFDTARRQFAEHVPYPQDNPPTHNEFIKFDSRGILWLGGGAGLYRYDPNDNSWRRFVPVKDDPHSLGGSLAMSFLEDHRGDIWVGTNRGLDRLDPASGQFTHFQNDPAIIGSLNGKLVSTVFEDRHGTLWIGTESALNRMEVAANGAIRFRAYPIEEVDAIQEDQHGILWVATDSGISRLDPGSGETKHYTERDGMAEGGYFDSSAAIAGDGTLYFGSPNGLTVFRPEDIRDNPYPPLVQITDFQIFNKSVGAGKGVEGFVSPGSIPQTKALTLSYLHSVFSIEFAALHFADPQSNRFAYRLEGFDKEWIYTDASRRVATYTNLDAGHYVFRVNAANKDGVWNDTGATLDITITPPLWKTWWFRTIVSSLLMGGAWWAYRMRVRNLIRQNAMLEARVAQRTAEVVRQMALVDRKNEDLEQANHELEVANDSLAVANEIQTQQKSELTRFLAVASHDLRQPMHALNIYLAALFNVEMSSGVRELLGKVRQCASVMDDMFLALLDLSRLDAGVVQPKVTHFPIASVLKTLVVEFAPQAEAKGLVLEALPSDAWVESDASLVQQILGNLIANAVRYTEKGRINIGCTARNGRLMVSVRDTGVGISTHQQKTIFEEFCQLGNSGHDRTKGLGLGLAIVKRLSTLLGAPVTLVSEVGRGSMFTLDLPLVERQIRELPVRAEGEEKSVSGALEGKLVVVVDDERVILDSTSILLQQWGCRVVTAYDSSDAKAALGGEVPDLLICDYRLRIGENGVDVIIALRNQFNRDIPALVITGDTAPDLIRDTLSTGLTVMYKPLQAAALRETLLRLVAHRTTPA